jgi:hypothetical protein
MSGLRAAARCEIRSKAVRGTTRHPRTGQTQGLSPHALPTPGAHGSALGWSRWRDEVHLRLPGRPVARWQVVRHRRQDRLPHAGSKQQNAEDGREDPQGRSPPRGWQRRRPETGGTGYHASAPDANPAASVEQRPLPGRCQHPRGVCAGPAVTGPCPAPIAMAGSASTAVGEASCARPPNAAKPRWRSSRGECRRPIPSSSPSARFDRCRQ